jgi:hypothetical protein
MKTLLTAVILFAATFAFADDTPQPAAPVTNSVANTNEPSGYKPYKPHSKADGYTGATRKSKKQKQDTP